MEFQELGKIFLYLGLFIIVVGALMIIAGKVPGVGRLPGDIFIKRDNISFYFPLATSILISIVLTIILNLFLRR